MLSDAEASCALVDSSLLGYEIPKGRSGLVFSNPLPASTQYTPEARVYVCLVNQ